MATQTPSMNSSPTPESKGLRSAFRRWKNKWRLPSSSSSRKSMLNAPTTRPPTNSSSITPPTAPLRSVPSSPVPLRAALFAPTTETTIHSPADPRNRSASPSPANTLRKAQRPGIPRRNTLPSEYLASAGGTSHAHPEDYSNMPLNLVTTTIVAGNGNAQDNSRRNRQSRLRLSFSNRNSVVPSPLGSPAAPRSYDKSSSRATGRFEAVPEVGMGAEIGARERADSYREGLLEEAEMVSKDHQVKEIEGGSGRGTPIPEAAS